MKYRKLLIIFVISLLWSCNNDYEIKDALPLVDARDGKTYTCKKIGTKIWMIENMAYETKDGQSYYYANNPLKYQAYGRLYFKESVAEASSIKGWHIPDSTEWMELFKCYKIENEGTWDAINLFLSKKELGFNFQMGGMWHLNWINPSTPRERSFEYMNNEGYYWAQPLDAENYYSHAYGKRVKIYDFGFSKEKPTYKGGEKYRFSLRLVKD
jgi:uncharacterized protein (TIGR02145 family)